MLSVAAKGGFPDGDVKEAVAPGGTPEALRATGCGDPDSRLIERSKLAVWPMSMLTLDGDEAAISKSKGGGGGLTAKSTETEWDRAPLVPVIARA
jgi:hypothetical protein